MKMIWISDSLNLFRVFGSSIMAFVVYEVFFLLLKHIYEQHLNQILVVSVLVGLLHSFIGLKFEKH